MEEKNAYDDLIEYLEKGEQIEAIIFGAWGWDGYNEPEPPIIDHALFGKVMTLEEAMPYLKRFSFYSGYGAPECHAVRVFTNQRIIWVTQYDGSTTLDSSIRNPQEGYMPDMPGG